MSDGFQNLFTEFLVEFLFVGGLIGNLFAIYSDVNGFQAPKIVFIGIEKIIMDDLWVGVLGIDFIQWDGYSEINDDRDV